MNAVHVDLPQELKLIFDKVFYKLCFIIYFIHAIITIFKHIDEVSFINNNSII